MAKKKRGPQRRTICPLLKMGTHVDGENGWTLVNATDGTLIVVTQEAIDNAVPGDPHNCVMAVAMRAAFGDKYDYEVSSSIIKIIDEDNKVCLRFATPIAVRKALQQFDKPGRWQGLWRLPAGMIRLAPLPKSWAEGYSGTAPTRKPKKKKRSAKTIRVEGGSPADVVEVKTHRRRIKTITRLIERRFIRRRKS